MADQLAAEQSQKQTLADQLAAEQSRRQILADQLAAEQSRRQTLTDQLAAVQAYGHSQAEQITLYEQRLQSQDLMTRHLVKLTLNNIGDLARNPQQVGQKLKRWIRYRLKGEKFNRSEPTSDNASTSSLSYPSNQQISSSSEPLFTEIEQTWLAEIIASRPPALAILHPDWIGIRSSTVNLIPSHLFVTDNIDIIEARRLAHLLSETGCARLVFSGFALNHGLVIEALRELKPEVKIFILWHGNLLQSSEEYNWRAFQRINQLYKQGYIYKWGFVKEGMAEELAARGYRTGFVMNYVKEIPTGPSTTLAGGPHLGIWGAEWNWRKYPYAMLAACGLIPGVTGHFYNTNPRIIEFINELDLTNIKLESGGVPQAQMSAILGQFHLNLYTTLSECAPMLPLESLAAGSPCLLGPNSHLFKDHDFLHRLLVVPYPDSAAVIADCAQRALAQREEIIRAYMEYAPGYNQRARDSLAKFLEI